MSLKLLVLRVTQKCNLSCEYCYAFDGTEENMPVDIALRAVEMAAQPGETLKIQFAGGEPLLNMECIEAVYEFGRITGRKLVMSLQTNGTLLTIENCNKLKKMNIAVGVSIDGIGDADKLRKYPDGRPSFRDAAEGIKNLGRCNKKCNLMAVVTFVNERKLDNLLDLALYFGNVYGIGLDIFRPIGRGKNKNLTASEKELSAGVDSLLNKYDEFQKINMPVRIKELERIKHLLKYKQKKDLYCYAQTQCSLAVDTKGNLYPCSSFVCKEHLLGHLDNYESAVFAARKCDALPKTCRNCSIVSYCRGGCPANSDKKLICILNKRFYDYANKTECEV